jgi:hypothetical protein
VIHLGEGRGVLELVTRDPFLRMNLNDFEGEKIAEDLKWKLDSKVAKFVDIVDLIAELIHTVHEVERIQIRLRQECE